MRYTVEKKTSQVGELIISSLREEDEGTYTCLVTNSRGSIGHNITVRAESRVVAGRPQIQVLGYCGSLGPFHFTNSFVDSSIEYTYMW